jgi:hypothetical protein
MPCQVCHLHQAKISLQAQATDLEEALSKLPVETSYCARQELAILDAVKPRYKPGKTDQAAKCPNTIHPTVKTAGFGDIPLSWLIAKLVPSHFDYCDHFASYAGVVPRNNQRR